MKLSVIIPFVGEFPQVLFTIQSIAQELIDEIDFEIIAVNNYCEQVKKQAQGSAQKALSEMLRSFGEKNSITEDDIFKVRKSVFPTHEDRSGQSVEACSKINPWLKYIEYSDRLSHWQAKRVGVENSTGDILMFVDAHCIVSKNAIVDAIFKYGSFLESGTLHLPLTYKILESRRLIYKFAIEQNAFYSYKFTPLTGNVSSIIEVPCMSTCGMIISREVYNAIGGWPHNLGIYGGGENFLNYTLAVCGYKKFIYTGGTLFHHGEKRDYHYEYNDMLKNRMVAHYLFGGEELLSKFCTISKGNWMIIEQLRKQVLKENKPQRDKIKSIQVKTIEEWVKERSE